MLRRNALFAGAAVTLVVPAYAQVPVSRNGYQYFVVSSCGTASYSPLLGSYGPPTVDVHGNVCVPASSGGSSTAAQTASNASDAQATSNANQQAVVFPYLFNGSTYDRWRGTGGSANVSVGNFPAIQQVSPNATANSSSNPFFVTTTNPTSNTVNQGSPAAVGNAWPTYLTQGGAANAAGNPLFEQTVGPSMQAPGTGPTIVRGVQGAAAGIPVNTAETGTSTAAAGITPIVTTGGTSAVGKTSQGNLYSAFATATTAPSAQQYLVLINATAVPTSGAAITPVDFSPFSSNAVGGTATVNYGAGPPSAYSSGIVALVSTSLTTYTPGAASAINVRVR